MPNFPSTSLQLQEQVWILIFVLLTPDMHPPCESRFRRIFHDPDPKHWFSGPDRQPTNGFIWIQIRDNFERPRNDHIGTVIQHYDLAVTDS